MPITYKNSFSAYCLPRRLYEGDRVMIISPSSEIASFPRRLKRGMEELYRLGLEPILAPNALSIDGHRAGTPESRASDIMCAFCDKSIRGIFASTGGWNSNAVLPLLDYRAIRKNPKPLIGFSDITAILLAIVAQSRLVVFHGPTVLPTMGEADGMFDFSRTHMRRVLFSDDILGELPEPTESTEELLWWDLDDVRPRRLVKNEGRRCVRAGEAEGIILGGNLDTLTGIVGTEYWPESDHMILLLEEESGNTAKLERDIQTLILKGAMECVNGLIFARPYRFTTLSEKRTLYDILRDVGDRFNIPVLADVSVGHTNPILTVPLGVRAYLNATSGVICILEQCTCADGGGCVSNI